MLISIFYACVAIRQHFLHTWQIPVSSGIKELVNVRHLP
jgi:hypothetical protein